MKIRPVWAELFHADGQTNKHDEGYICFSQFLWTQLKIRLFEIRKNAKGLLLL
jgi:hypothetical protein